MKILDRGCWTFLAAAALIAAPWTAAKAEEAVGLEAQGVDPWAALRQGDLDVRDELGRPVRAQVIVSQLKAANAEAAAQASYSSLLPRAASVVRMLELLQALSAWFAAAASFSGDQVLWALAPLQRSPQRSLLLTLLSCLSCAAAGTLRSQNRPAFQRSNGSAPPVLRC